MNLVSRCFLFAISGSLCYAQLTVDQKVSDFQFLSSLYAKRYGPYEWKRDALGVDLFSIAPWLAKVQATKNDLDFYEVMSEYVASLNDAHDTYFLPASFQANLNFSVDLYDGKLLVDFINRTRLPASEFGFIIGYELVSIDGQDAQKLLDGLLRYQSSANARSTRRMAAQLLTSRSQRIMPHAPDVPEISVVQFRRADGAMESYRIPWTKTGLPFTTVGRYPTPGATAASAFVPGRQRRGTDDSTKPGETPEYLRILEHLQNCQLPDRGVVGFGVQAPVFSASMPTSFVQRQGRLTTDPFYSGVFSGKGHQIGYIRIPTFSPVSSALAIAAFQTEIAYFQANTEGLVVDVMRNLGGSGGYANSLLSYLIPVKWRSIPFELRATSEWVTAISSALVSAAAQGAPPSAIDQLQSIKDKILAANKAMRGRTEPIPLDGTVIDREPATDIRGAVLAYNKPLIVLVDEMSASAAELFAATIQDNQRGPLVGWRTMGAGGNVESWETGSYSLGITSVTESIGIRKNPIVTTDYPTAPYIENIGVRPEISLDYMIAENLARSGKPFVDAFVAAIAAHIESGK